ncbi:MAG: hypothetical protein AB8H86_03595 [Polyangiales bacterium]
MPRQLFSALNLATLAALLCTTQASAQSPVFDDGYLAIDLSNEVNGNGGTQPADVNYHPQMQMRFYGAADGDAVKVRWQQGGETLAQIRCPLEARHGHHRTHISQRCWTQDAPHLTAFGDVDVEIIFVDDSEETETSVRTLRVPVGRYWHWDRRVGRTDVHSPRYQVRADDMMGMSYLWQKEADRTEAFGNVYIFFWASLANGNTNYRDASWRCSLNGERVPALDVNDSVVESVLDISVDNDQMVRGERTTTHYTYRMMWIKPQMLWDPSGGQSGATPWRYNLTANPGDYACRLRDNGETIREFRFTVSADGSIAQHAVQAAEGGPTLPPGASFIETYFPERNASETFFDRDAIRRGFSFGRPWPSSPAVSGWLDALPPSYGNGEPTPPPGVRGRRGRRGMRARPRRGRR